MGPRSRSQMDRKHFQRRMIMCRKMHFSPAKAILCYWLSPTIFTQTFLFHRIDPNPPAVFTWMRCAGGWCESYRHHEISWALVRVRLQLEAVAIDFLCLANVIYGTISHVLARTLRAPLYWVSFGWSSAKWFTRVSLVWEKKCVLEVHRPQMVLILVRGYCLCEILQENPNFLWQWDRKILLPVVSKILLEFQLRCIESWCDLWDQHSLVPTK